MPAQSDRHPAAVIPEDGLVSVRTGQSVCGVGAGALASLLCFAEAPSEAEGEAEGSKPSATRPCLERQHHLRTSASPKFGPLMFSLLDFG
jgi:hypothetical protein